MASFKTLNLKKYQKTEKVITPDTLYWRRLSAPTLVKEFGAIDFIDFNAIEPYHFAVTCSVRVQIYNPITKLVVKNLSRFQETAYGGTFRQDGRLLVAGDEEGLVKLFDTSSKNVLRLCKGHKAAVHRTCFTQDLLRIASFSDDKTVKLWDIATEKPILTYAEHADYIRAGAVSPVSKDIVMSAGYDGKIKLYDTRAKEVSFTIDHESPVESLLFLPTGGIFLSAGSTEIRVWDALAGGRLLTRLSQHHKTVTCLRLASNGKRILSGSLDRHVKIYDVASYQTVNSLDFPNAVLSLGISPNDHTLAVGMVDGLISVQNMEPEKDKDAKRVASTKKPQRLTSVHIDHDVPEEIFKKDRIYDNMLRRYEYVKCLDAALTQKKTRHEPQLVVSIMQELIRRKGLRRALTARSHASLSVLISFICRYIGDQRYMRVLIDVASILFDVYEDSFHEYSGELNQQFKQLADTMQRETALTYELLELRGAFETLFIGADTAGENDRTIHFVGEERTNVDQSAQAEESFIVTV